MIPSRDEHVLYKGEMFISKDKLKTTLGKLALKDKFEYRIRRYSKTHFEASCRDIACKFELHAIAMQGGIYCIVAKFVKDHTCDIKLFRNNP